MKNKLKILILKLVLFLILSIPPANCVEQISESDIYSFAEHLFSQKDYYRAITEYKRLLFYFPKGKFTDDSKFKIAKSYQLGNKTSLAFNLFSDLEKEFEGKDLGLLADFESIECFYRARDYQTALNSYFKFIEAKKYKNFVDMATYRIGLSNLHLKNTEKAKNYFDSIEEQSKLHGLASEMTEKTTEFEKLKRKSPFLAGLLSTVIPGAGQFYNGRVKDGIIALITNGLFIWGTYEAYKREYYSIGIVTGVFAFGWYTGNIYGAVNGAHKYNRKKENTFFNSLKDRYEILAPNHDFY